ncbi:AI-2E family transporter [Fluviibacterium sp. S390]|uniref:AI-2E family transporter n=1 Tax=Fluviibacterium sp. S390 TaxID=3415139 RepID=UPI003C7CE833
MQSFISTRDPVLRVATIAIAVILVFATLKLGAEIFAPMAMGVVAGVILAPITQALERVGLPVGLSAVLVLLLGVSGLFALAFLLEPMVGRLVEELPRIKWELRATLQDIRDLFRGIDAVNREVGAALGAETGADAQSTAPEMPGVTDALLLAPFVLAQLLIFCGTLFFFLLTRKSIYRGLARLIGTSADTLVLLRRFDAAERMVARYFFTITLINAGLGVFLGSVLSLIGVPGPFIWGAAAALLNFMVYVGPMMMTVGLLLAGLVAFNGLMVLAPVAAYLLLNLLESQFVTPALLGRHMAVNPLLIFVSLVVWLWIWGPIGGIVAIPILVITIVMLDLFEPDSDTATGQDADPDEPAPQGAVS